MATPLVEIIEKVGLLSPDERRQLREMLMQDELDVERERRKILSRSIKGKYAGMFPTPEERAKQKAEEIALEDRRSERL